ncbi:MmoB/DmpM family protein [Streptomyces sp. AK02-04a]|uniref:MmoB/DmpM family protein n=1 Tax=Streptomyces sp. AK02-04a TaxID=3028649 RepID=UPI0029B9CA63|nr:MmoB/DmpM family protein [Streptomyces sp. AK02-04a]MDX3763658.1 MmoB/DmpM family protein [Streptomyces sp. AK02-04a]
MGDEDQGVHVLNEKPQPGPKLVGPIIRGTESELADAIIAAIETDNRDNDVQVIDRGGYIRIQAAWECRLTRASLEEELGFAYPLSQIENVLTAFAGRMRATEDQLTWYLENREIDSAKS